METKLSVLFRHVANGDYESALKLANKWQNLGIHKAAIRQAAQAVKSPQFYKDIDQDPQSLIDLGIQALHERYHIPSNAPLGLTEQQYEQGYAKPDNTYGRYKLIKIIKADGQEVFVVHDPYWLEWKRLNRYQIIRVNDGSILGCYQANHKVGGQSFHGFGKSQEEAIDDLENIMDTYKNKKGNKHGKTEEA
jgi:hypothetical protein